VGFDPNCPLCRKEPLTPHIYEDEVCWVCYCATHRDTPMIVLNDHRPYPTEEEWLHIRKVAKDLFPLRRFRGFMGSMPDHWHEHLIE